MDVEFDHTLDGADGNPVPLHVKATGTPGRPAPPCSNPSSPAFSDPGDPPDVDIVSAVDLDFDRSYLDKLTDEEYEELADAAAEQMQGVIDSERDDAADDHLEQSRDR